MGQIVPLLSNFSMGEIDPRMRAAIDLDLGKKGAKRIRNCVITPQRNIRRRFGLTYVTQLGTYTGVTTYTDLKIAIFVDQDGIFFEMVFESGIVSIYQDSVLLGRLNTPYKAGEIADIKYTQTFDSMVCTHSNYAPIQIKRSGGVSIGFTVNVINFVNFPSILYDKSFKGNKFTPSANWASSDAPLSITATAACFDATMINGIFYGNEGTVRITALDGANPTTKIWGYTITSFKPGVSPQPDPAPIDGANVAITVPVWSVTKGFPRTCTFFENRLWLCSSQLIPSGIWGSVSDDYFNFDDSQPEIADNGISIYLQIGKTNNIKNVLSAQSLFIFTDGGVSATILSNYTPITPSAISFRRQSTEPASNVLPIFYDQQVIAVDKGGHIIQGFIYDDSKLSYQVADVSIFAQHLINHPIVMSPYKNPSVDNGSYLFVVNQDGTLAIFQSMNEQKIAAWSLATTVDKSNLSSFRDVASEQDQVYFIVERYINGVKKFYMEKLDFDRMTDCCYYHTYGSPTATITGLSHLEGELVSIKGDGIIFAPQTVTGGSIVLSQAVTTIEVGLRYDPLLIPMPIMAQVQDQSFIYSPMHLKTLYVDYYESAGIYANGQLIPDYEFGTSTFNGAIVPHSGVAKISTMTGWTPRTEITITQYDPLPFTILGLGMVIEIGG